MRWVLCLWFMTGWLIAEPLQWDALSKRFHAKRGETNAVIVFNVTNVSSAEIIVKAIRPACDCTEARVPELPWRLGRGTHGPVEIHVDLRDRRLSFSQMIAVETSAGTNWITVQLELPELTVREKNRLAAFADRQAVFKSDCAKCHLEPAIGKRGADLFKTICAICHASKERAEMVPDLAALKKPTDPSYWDQWLRRGKPGTYMPAFSKPFGGPLDEVEIKSLILFLAERFPSPSASLPPALAEPAK